jgi:hypothetical protein
MVTRAVKEQIVCTPKELPEASKLWGALRAIQINPVNRPPVEKLDPNHLQMLTTKYWGSGGVSLSVGFVEQTSSELRNKILSYMNRWGQHCKANFYWTQTDPQVRISRGRGGYWSYLGTDILQIPRNEPTMNLEGFTLSTSDSECKRVVYHETGHTMGFPHEHSLREVIALLDERKTINYFRKTQGWSENEIRNQILTPLQESSLLGREPGDTQSIMCYQFPGSITKNGKPILGGSDLDEQDIKFCAKVYPKEQVPPQPPPPDSSGNYDEMRLYKSGVEVGRYIIVKRVA